MSQAALAETSQVSPATIKLIERGMSQPKPDTLRRLAQGLATDGNGVLSEAERDLNYTRLMVAAGYAPPTLLSSAGEEGEQQATPEERVADYVAGQPRLRVALARIGALDDESADSVIGALEFFIAQ